MSQFYYLPPVGVVRTRPPGCSAFFQKEVPLLGWATATDGIVVGLSVGQVVSDELL